MGNGMGYGMGNGMGLMGLFVALGVFMVLIVIAVYLLEAIAFYKAFRKADIEYAWLAFIPIAQLWPFMRVIKKSAWNLFWLFCPIANIVFLIVWQGRYFKAYGISRWWLLMYIGTVIPGVSYAVSIAFIVIYCVIGFSSTHRYNPHFDDPSTGGPGMTF